MALRTPNLPGTERRREKQPVGKAVKREGMEREAPQVLSAW